MFAKDVLSISFYREELSKWLNMDIEDILGYHEGEAIHINQRLVLDALRNPDACIALFLAMLIEYGNFLGDALNKKANSGGVSQKPRAGFSQLPVSGKQVSKIAGLKGYHYEEMVKRLNEADKGKVDSIGFYESSEGKLGVRLDLLYDTYKKKWSKAYQLTFYCFFRQIDYLSEPGSRGYSCSHENANFRFVNGNVVVSRKYLFWDVITKDIECLIGNAAKLNEMAFGKSTSELKEIFEKNGRQINKISL